MPDFTNCVKHVEQLSSIKGNYTQEVTQQKIILLQHLLTCPLTKTAVIIKYHDSLLFLCSQPDNPLVYQLAIEGLEKIKLVVKKIFDRYSPSKQAALNGTGIYGTELVCSFSYDIAQWLCNKFGELVSIHSCGASTETVNKILELYLPRMEYQEITQNNFDLHQRIKKLTGKKSKSASLRWLLDTLRDNITTVSVRDVLYEQLQVYIHWKPEEPLFSRTFLRAMPQKIFYHDVATGKIDDYTALIRKKIQPAIILTATEQTLLLDVARASLAFQHRETDPVTFGESKTIQYFNMGYGVSIALYTLQPSKRFSIESYIGYLAFSNSVPVAYGGGWLFGERCKIGVNIYPAFRGGNSTFLFASILRLYYQFLGARCFFVKPYQFGKNNPEGLRSGAFWFYYKLGFVPVDESLRKLAADEYKKKQSKKTYRTPIGTLKHLTRSPVVLKFNKKAAPSFDAGIISKAVTQYVIKNFAGDRNSAMEHLKKELTKLTWQAGYKSITHKQSEILQKQAAWIAILFADKTNNADWTVKEKQQLIRLLLLKYAEKETDYIYNFQKHKKLLQVLNELYGN